MMNSLRISLPFLCLLSSLLAGTCTSRGVTAAPEPAALDRAFALLERYAWGESRELLAAIDEAIQASFGNSAQRTALEARLLALLKTPAPAAAKQFVCEKLSLVGSARSVPALAELLSDVRLSHSARFALERIGWPEASRALRSALPGLTGRLKTGVINSLGILRDPAAVPPLSRLLSGEDTEIANASAAALGNIGTIESVGALEEFGRTASEHQRTFATVALLSGAERLLQQGERAGAARVFRELYRPQNPPSIRLAAFIGVLTAEPDAASDLISRALRGSDEDERSVAARLISRGPNAPALEPFLAEFKSYPVAGQLALLEACRIRAEPTGRTAALSALQMEEPRLRLRALRSLGVIGSADDLPLLLALAASGSDAEKEAARSALVSIPDGQFNAAMAKRLRSASPDAQVVLIAALEARGATQASAAMESYLTNPNEGVRGAAIEALKSLGGVEQVPAIIRVLRSAASAAVRQSAESTLQAIASRAGAKCAPPVLAALDKAKGPSQAILLRVLGTAAGSQALDYLRNAVRDQDAAESAAALRVLAEWPGAEAAPDLLRLSQSCRNPNLALLAFRGYVRLCRAEPDGEKRRRMISESLDLARTVAQKRLLIQALGDLHDASSLPVLEPFFAEPDLIEVTSLAVATIAADAKPRHHEALRAALRKAARLSVNPDLAERARTLLDQLGPARK